MTTRLPDAGHGRVRRPSPPAYPWAVSLHRTPTPSFAEGAGVVISRRQVLTCRHVVEPAAGGEGSALSPGDPSIGTGWWVICHQHQPGFAPVAVERIVLPPEGSMADLALLELAADVPRGITAAPVARLTALELVEDGWWAYGHPDGDPFGNTARGSVGDALAYGYLRLDLDGVAGEEIAPGFSGAGLWSPTRRAVVAIVAQHGKDGGGRAVTLTQVSAHLPGAVFTGAEGSEAAPAAAGAPSDRRPAELQEEDLADDEPTVVAPPPGTLIGAVPIQPRSWVYRLALLAEVRAALEVDDADRRVVSLVGPAGVGKSQLAGEYARQAGAAGDAVVVWIGAESATGVRDGYAELGQRLGLGSEGEDSAALARKTLAYLSGTRHPFLLVLDNAESLGVIEPYLPIGGRCRVLITTRDDDERFGDLGRVVTVRGFDPVTSVDFLTREGGLTPETALAVAASVDGLPLALAIAGGATSHGQRPSTGDTGRQDPAESVESMLAEAVSAAVQSVPGAAQVLTTLAVLSAEGTSRYVLAQVSDGGDSNGSVVEALIASGLVNVSGDNLLTVHRLTALAIRHLDPASTDAERARVAVHLESLVKDREATPRLSETDHEVVRHTRAFVDSLDRSTPVEASTAIAALGDRVLTLLRLGGNYSAQLPLARELVARLIEVLGPDHPATLVSRGNLAMSFWAVGRYQDAIALHEQTLIAQDLVLGPDHPDTLTTRNNLAVDYQAVGRYENAIILDEQTLTTQERVLGLEHRDTLASRNNLANGYGSVGRYQDAITLHQQTLTTRERVLGPDHPDTLNSRNNLATSYDSVGRYQDAITLDEQTLASRERVLGPDHPDTLMSRNNLATSYESMGRHEDAITLFEQTVTAMERVLGTDHPDTLRSRNNLARAQRAVSGDQTAARRLVKAARRLFRRP